MHSKPILNFLLLDDMKRLISAGKDKKIQVWDIFSQKNIITLNEHTEQINSIALSIDQRYLISGGDD